MKGCDNVNIIHILHHGTQGLRYRETRSRLKSRWPDDLFGGDHLPSEGEDRVLESVESVLDFSKVHYDNERLQYHSKYREKTITPRWRNILISVAYLDEGHQGSEAPKIIKVGGHGTFIITLITFYLNNIIYVENNILNYKKLYKNRKKIRIHVSYIKWIHSRIRPSIISFKVRPKGSVRKLTKTSTYIISMSHDNKTIFCSLWTVGITGSAHDSSEVDGIISECRHHIL